MTTGKAQWAVDAAAKRDAAVLAAGIALAKEVGYQWITRDDVARRARVSPGTVNNAFHPFVELKRAVLREAVRAGIVEIVAQGLADGHEIAKGAPPDLKERAVSFLNQ